MSNRHNSPNRNEEDEDQLPDGRWQDEVKFNGEFVNFICTEEEQNPASSGYICVAILLLIPIQQPIRN
jgi:hypothetical protein